MKHYRFQRLAFPTFHRPALTGLASFAPTDELHEARLRRAMRQLSTIEPRLSGDIAAEIERRDDIRGNGWFAAIIPEAVLGHFERVI
jgi:hypothetical protein